MILLILYTWSILESWDGLLKKTGWWDYDYEFPFYTARGYHDKLLAELTPDLMDRLVRKDVAHQVFRTVLLEGSRKNSLKDAAFLMTHDPASRCRIVMVYLVFAQLVVMPVEK